ncbi:MAG: glycoside hydrolase family 32 protein [Verrucomicrobia bacterium]|nr:glycoside hydrolase family 32 protein [Verrucomicrobiota bacterium]
MAAISMGVSALAGDTASGGSNAAVTGKQQTAGVKDEALAAQEAKLRDHPLLRRFAESRRKLAADPYRPLYHFVTPESTLNDPNGLCFWNGRWHLFYQAYPPENRNQHWGHTVSDDLIHWRDLPYAIKPGPENACFSGSTLVESNRVIAMYHGTGQGNMVAISSDPLLLDWEKLTGKPVIPSAGAPCPIYDPCIWKKDGMYYSLSGGALPAFTSPKSHRAEFLFRSADLKTWQYLHPFVEGDVFGYLGEDGACPYFWPIGNRHILLSFSHIGGGSFLLGDYDTARDKFVATQGGRFNFGAVTPSGVHAPSATPDGKGGVITIFNMNPGKTTSGWDQIMSLPRRLTLIGKDELGVEPVGDIESLRGANRHLAGVALPANQEVVLEGVQGNALEIVAEIDPGKARMIELDVLRSAGKEEYTRIVLFKQCGLQNWARNVDWKNNWYRTCDSLISLDTAYSSTLPDVTLRAPETAPFWFEPDKPLKLRVFIDKSVVEVFVNGRQCVAARVYPERADSKGVSLRAQGSDAVLKQLDAWTMKSIYAE